MKTTFISKENNEVKFTMEYTAEEFEAAVVKAYQETKNQFVIDGFRKGKAPRGIIEKHYGEGVFYEDAINEMFRVGYPEAVKELAIEVIDSPRAEFSEIGKNKPMTVTITVPVFPIVEVKDYFGVEIEQVEAKVKSEDVDKEIEALRKRNSRMVIAERPVKDGDTVILDYAGFVGEEQFEGGTAEMQELKIGSGMFIPGFEEQLVDAKAGDDVDVKVTFPEEYHSEDLAGKDAVFHCHIHEVKEELLPELDDEFAKDVSEFDTLDELKKSTEEKLQKYADAQSVNAAKDDIILKVCDANEIELPAVMVEDEIDRMAQELDHQMRYQGLSLDKYLEFVKKDVKDFRDELRPEAEMKVRTRIILLSIVEAEKIDVTEDEIDEALKDMAAQYNMAADEAKKMIGEEGMEFFKKDVKIKKTIDMMYEKASIKMVEKKEEEADSEAAEEK